VTARLVLVLVLLLVLLVVLLAPQLLLVVLQAPQLLLLTRLEPPWRLYLLLWLLLLLLDEARALLQMVPLRCWGHHHVLRCWPRCGVDPETSALLQLCHLM
jgi:hypothetical protein